MINVISNYFGGCAEKGWHEQKEILQKLTEKQKLLKHN